MQIQLNSIHSLYSSKTCNNVHAEVLRKKIEIHDKNMTNIKPKKIINKHNLYFILKKFGITQVFKCVTPCSFLRSGILVLSIVKYQKIQLCFTM